MNNFDAKKIRQEIEAEVKRDYQKKIENGEIVIQEKDPQREFQKNNAEMAAKTRIIK